MKEGVNVMFPGKLFASLEPMMACALCKLVSGDNKIPLNTYSGFKKRSREKRSDEEKIEDAKKKGDSFKKEAKKDVGTKSLYFISIKKSM